MILSATFYYKEIGYEFVVIALYVDDLNSTETFAELSKAVYYLKREFDMKH